MGNILSYLADLFSSFTCKKNNINICICTDNLNKKGSDNNIDLNLNQRYSHGDEIQSIIYGDTEYYLSTHELTEQYYIDKNIGTFITDIDGVATYISDNVALFVGLKREDLLQSISWVANIAENNYFEYENWSNTVKDECPYIRKLHFKFGGGKTHMYTISEAHPIYNRKNKFKGYKGILLRVPHQIWNIFKELDFYESELYVTLKSQISHLSFNTCTPSQSHSGSPYQSPIQSPVRVNKKKIEIPDVGYESDYESKEYYHSPARKTRSPKRIKQQ